MRWLGNRVGTAVCFGVLGTGILAQESEKKSGYDYVNPLIGTINGGMFSFPAIFFRGFELAN